MQLGRLVLINIKRQLKNPGILLMTIVMPVIMLLFMNGTSSDEKLEGVGIIDNSKSNYSKEMILELEKEYTIDKLSGQIEDNYNLLRENKLGVIYVIDSNFQKQIEDGKVPEVKSYTVETSNGSMMAENIIKNYIFNKLEEKISEGLSANSINTVVKNIKEEKETYKMTIIMLCYFMMLGGGIVSTEIIRLKEQKVLRRTIATANKDVTILGSLFISSFLLQGILSVAGFIFIANITKIPANKIPEGSFIIFLGSLITTAIVVAATRWIKNPVIASLSTMVFGLLAFGLGMLGTELTDYENIPASISRISIISPFTWLLRIINTNEIIVPTLIIVLMSLVFFTAGSFRLRQFVKE